MVRNRIVARGRPRRYLRRRVKAHCPSSPPRHEDASLRLDHLRDVLDGSCFEAGHHDLLALLRGADGRAPGRTAAIFDIRVIQTTPGSRPRVCRDGYKRQEGPMFT